MRNDGPPETKQLIIDISKENTNIDQAVDNFTNNARQIFSGSSADKNILGGLKATVSNPETFAKVFDCIKFGVKMLELKILNNFSFISSLMSMIWNNPDLISETLELRLILEN